MVVVIINKLLYLAFTIWMAWYHSKLIKQNKPIKHGWWGLLAVAVAGVFALINVWYFPVLIMERALFFSPFLNQFRGLPFWKWSTTTTSIIDKWEQKIFKTFRTRTIVYAILIIIFEVILLWQLKH